MPEELDKPTRSTILQLFRELNRSKHESPLYDAYEQLDDECGVMEQRLLNDKRYLALCKKRDEARRKANKLEHERREAIAVVHREFLAKGLTPQVKVKLSLLLEKLKP